MKKTLLALAVTAAAVSAQADVKLSGQVNSATVFGGDVDDPTTVDNTTTGTRFRIQASRKGAGGLTYGTRLEYQIQDNASQNLTDNLATNGGEVRYSDVYLKGSFGKIGIGKGDGAANGAFESFGLLNFLGGSESHLLWSGATNLAYSDIDGVSRQNRIRYDSPNFSGFKFAVTLDNLDQNEYALHYNGKVLGGKLRVRYGAVDVDTSADRIASGQVTSGDVESVSFAYKHSSGIGIAFSDGTVDGIGGAEDNEADWAQISYTIGKLTASYGTGESGAGVDNEFNTLSFNYKPAKGVEIYLNFLDFENDANTVVTDLNGDAVAGADGDATALGARFKF